MGYRSVYGLQLGSERHFLVAGEMMRQALVQKLGNFGCNFDPKRWGKVYWGCLFDIFFNYISPFLLHNLAVECMYNV